MCWEETTLVTLCTEESSRMRPLALRFVNLVTFYELVVLRPLAVFVGVWVAHGALLAWLFACHTLALDVVAVFLQSELVNCTLRLTVLLESVEVPVGFLA